MGLQNQVKEKGTSIAASSTTTTSIVTPPSLSYSLPQEPFPKKFPFSEFVPRVYSQIKEFIYACLKFSEDLHLSSTEVDDMIRKATNLLLTRTLSNCLQNVIKKQHIGLTEVPSPTHSEAQDSGSLSCLCVMSVSCGCSVSLYCALRCVITESVLC
uniref:Exocyst complex component 6B-like n=1 Tax=Callorhinchus milii TaxID=7868 RepID=A0A4W3H0M1_CALMI